MKGALLPSFKVSAFILLLMLFASLLHFLLTLPFTTLQK